MIISLNNPLYGVFCNVYIFMVYKKIREIDLLGRFKVKAANIIEISALIIIIFLLIIFVPRNKIREASVILMFKQMTTWLLGLAVVQLNWIEYPDRLFFSDATQTSFTFEYILYPAICVFFILYYPKHYGWVGQFMYYFIYCSAITTVEVLIEHYTTAIKYNEKWYWYTTWLSLFVTFYISRKFYLWFFKDLKKKWSKRWCLWTESLKFSEVASLWSLIMDGFGQFYCIHL